MIEYKRHGDTAFGNKHATIEDSKIESTSSGLFFEGYVNTKNKPDSYGDIPTGDNVYDLSRYKTSPVLLINHNNNVKDIAGKAVQLSEDEKGLWVKFKLMDNPVSQDVAHAIEAVRQGLLKTTSIGGRWEYDSKKPNNLIKASIFEISLVAIPADPRAIGQVVKSSCDKDDKASAEVIGRLVGLYRSSQDIKILKHILKVRKELCSQ